MFAVAESGLGSALDAPNKDNAGCRMIQSKAPVVTVTVTVVSAGAVVQSPGFEYDTETVGGGETPVAAAVARKSGLGTPTTAARAPSRAAFVMTTLVK
jgi:hypothetical protein